jgi:HK97 family phage portal protein
MSIFTKIFGRKEERAYDPRRGVRRGVSTVIYGDNALQIGTVYAAVSIVSRVLSTLPLHLYRETAGRKEKTRDHYSYHIVNGTPSGLQNHITWKMYMIASMLLRGNYYGELLFDRNYRVKSILPLSASQVKVGISDNGLRKVYKVAEKEIPGYKVLHIPYVSITNPLIGESVIELARSGLSLAKSAEQFGINFFDNGANAGGIITYEKDAKVTLDERKEIFKRIRETATGLTNSHLPMELPPGARFEKLTMSNADSEWIAMRKFQKSEIAAWFGVPPHLIGDLERSTNNNIEHQGMEAIAYLFAPLITIVENHFNTLFFPDGGHYYKFNLDAIHRADMETRYNSYATGIQWGVLSGNEAREKEDMNPQPDGIGDIYLTPLNMVDKKTLLDKPQDKKPDMKALYFKALESRNIDSCKLIFDSYVYDLSKEACREAGEDQIDMNGFIIEYTRQLENRLSETDPNDELYRLRNAVRYETWRRLGKKDFRYVEKCGDPACQNLDGQVFTFGNYIGIGEKRYHPPLRHGCTCEIILEDKS